LATKIYNLVTEIFPLVASWLPNEKVNFEPCWVVWVLQVTRFSRPGFVCTSVTYWGDIFLSKPDCCNPSWVTTVKRILLFKVTNCAQVLQKESKVLKVAKRLSSSILILSQYFPLSPCTHAETTVDTQLLQIEKFSRTANTTIRCVLLTWGTLGHLLGFQPLGRKPVGAISLHTHSRCTQKQQNFCKFVVRRDKW